MAALEDLRRMEEAFSKVERSSTQTNHALEDIHTLFNKITLGVGGPLLKAVEYITNSHGVWRSRLDEIGKFLTQNVDDIASMEASVEGHRNNILSLHSMMATATASELTTLTELMDVEERTMKYMQQRLATSRLFLDISRTTVQSVVFLAAGFLRASYAVSAYNKALIETNNLEGNRSRIMGESSSIAGKLGVSLQEMVSNARSLVSYGFDLKSNYSEVLEISTKLNEGLDLSVDSFAKIALISDTIKADYKSIADTIADMVHKTSLSANEMASIVEMIADAQLNLSKAYAVDDDVFKLIGRLEGAAKSVIGKQGDLSTFLSNLSTQGGLTQASLLGVDPDFLLRGSGIEEVIDNLQKFIEDNLGNSTGRERAARLEMISSLLGLEKKIVSNFHQIHEEFLSTRKIITGIDEARNAQVKEFYTAVGKITNSFMSLVARGFEPLVRVVTPLVDMLARFVEYLSNSKVVIASVSVALTVAIYAAVTGITRLTASLIALSVSANANAMGVFGHTGILSKFFSMLGISSASITALFSRLSIIFSPITSRLGLILTRMGSLVASLSPFILGPLIAGAVGYGIGSIIDSLFPFIGRGIEKIADNIYKALYPDNEGYYTAKGESNKLELSDVFDSFEMMIMRGASVADAIEFFNNNLASIRQIENSAINYADRADKTAKSVTEMLEDRLRKIQEIEANREISFDKQHKKQIEVLESISKDLPSVMNKVVDAIQEINKSHRDATKQKEKESIQRSNIRREEILGNLKSYSPAF